MAQDQVMLIVSSKAKAALKEHGLRSAADALTELSSHVTAVIDAAAAAAKAEGVQTVKDRHIREGLQALRGGAQ